MVSADPPVSNWRLRHSSRYSILFMCTPEALAIHFSSILLYQNSSNGAMNALSQCWKLCITSSLTRSRKIVQRSGGTDITILYGTYSHRYDVVPHFLHNQQCNVSRHGGSQTIYLSFYIYIHCLRQLADDITIDQVGGFFIQLQLRLTLLWRRI